MLRGLADLVFPVYRRLERSALLLRYLFLEVTQRCNLACLHCGSDCGVEPRPGELSVEEWVGFLDRLPRRIDTSRVVLVLTGGEPLCAPGLDQLLAALARNRLAWGMVSNGWALDRATLERLIAHGLQSLTLSLDGLRDAHDWLRGRSGSFDRVLRAVSAAADSGLPFFDVVTCVNPRNLDGLSALRALLRERRVAAWRLFAVFPRGRAAGNAATLLTDDQLARLLRWIAAERRRDPGAPAPEWSCEGFLPPELDRQVRGQPYFCRAGVNIASVLCDGAISACPSLSRSLVQGNIRHDDLAEVWSTRFAPFRDRRWLATGRCAGCSDWKACQGNSLHLRDDQAKTTVRCHRDLLSATSGRARLARCSSPSTSSACGGSPK